MIVGSCEERKATRYEKRTRMEKMKHILYQKHDYQDQILV